MNRFACVGAHHHNGFAKRSIQTIMSISRAMLIHAAIHWPDMADTKLWLMAVQQACFIWNKMPSISSGLSSSDIYFYQNEIAMIFTFGDVWSMSWTRKNPTATRYLNGNPTRIVVSTSDALHLMLVRSLYASTLELDPSLLSSITKHYGWFLNWNFKHPSLVTKFNFHLSCESPRYEFSSVR